MRSISKDKIIGMLDFVEEQGAFIERTTKHLNSYRDFLLSDTGMVLFNSTCMCLQTIGETVKQIDNLTEGSLVVNYTDIPWKRIIGLRNILSHEYAAIDPEAIFNTIRIGIPPLLLTVKKMIVDIEGDGYSALFEQ